MDEPHLLVYGEDAVLVELPDRRAVRRFADAVRRHPLADRLDEVIPAQQTVMLVGPLDVISTVITERVENDEDQPASQSRTVELAVRYDGADLDEYAERVGMTRQEVIGAHSGVTHRVDFFGFAPGLAYIYGVPDTMRVPRRATPRTRVPAGSVAVANGYTVIYPAATPGGWTLIGTLVDDPMWDVTSQPPNRVSIGDRIVFRPQR